METRKSTLSLILIFTAGILWSMTGIFVRRLTAAGLDSMQVVFLRMFFASIILFFVLLFKQPSLLKVKPKESWSLFGSGICGYAFFNFCYFAAIDQMPLSTAAVLLYIAPSLVMVISYFLFKESITPRKLAALCLAFGGCMCSAGIFSGASSVRISGVMIGLGSGLGYALITIFGRYAINSRLHSYTIVTYTLMIAAVCTGLLCDVKGVLVFMFSSLPHFGICFLFIFMGTILPNLFYTIGLTGVENGKASIVVSVEPVAATVFGAVIFHETLGLFGFLGIFLMVLSLLILNISVPSFLHGNKTDKE